MPCPYNTLLLGIDQIEDNFKWALRDSQTTQLKMSVSIVSTAVSSNNHPFLIGEQTSNCPRLEAGFVGQNDLVSFVDWSQSQPLTWTVPGWLLTFPVATLVM